MKYSHGILIVTILPIIILASATATGWYYYYSETNKYQSLTMDSRAELEKLQTTIDKLLDDETALQATLASEKISQDDYKAVEASLQNDINILNEENSQLINRLEQGMQSQEEQTALLEKVQAKKIAMEVSLQQVVNKATSTTAELEAELERRQAAQESLSDDYIAVRGEKSRLLTQLEQEQESNKRIANLKNRLERELNESRVEITQLKNQMTVIKLTSEVLFGSGSARIKPAGQKVLSIIAESLNAYPDRAISIEGHTDNVPVIHNARYESNWELSAARALAALNYFQQNDRVDPKRLKLVGYGQYRPVSSNETDEGRKRNRRIEIRMLPPQTIAIN